MREPRLALVLLTFLVMLSMALVAFLLARMPQKISEKFDSTHRDSPLDGLRGVLATFVFAHHFYLMHRWSLQGEWAVADNFGLHWMYFAQNLGAIPVSLFFMITGFLFLNKLKQKEINWKNLYIARIRRIMPLYLLSLLFVVYASGRGKCGVLGWCRLAFSLGNFSLSATQWFCEFYCQRRCAVDFALRVGILFQPAVYSYGNAPIACEQ